MGSTRYLLGVELRGLGPSVTGNRPKGILPVVQELIAKHTPAAQGQKKHRQGATQALVHVQVQAQAVAHGQPQARGSPGYFWLHERPAPMQTDNCIQVLVSSDPNRQKMEKIRWRGVDSESVTCWSLED